jgi:predicted metal-dependent RNase
MHNPAIMAAVSDGWVVTRPCGIGTGWSGYDAQA